MKYALWNNKGGVGKTFLTFVLATEYARCNHEAHVVVIDMCPQANVSEILLGGNGKGTENLAKLIEEGKTIGGYFTKRIISPHSKTNTELQHLINVEEFNQQIPSNLSLIAGDPSLEIQVQTINNLAVLELPRDSWKNVHSWVIDLEEVVQEHFQNRQVMFFVDCNPSFSSYTEQAILAADRLIVPCSPDGSSARAIRNVYRLVYGHDTPLEYKDASFEAKLKKFNMTSPNFYLAILNRATQYGHQPSKAFQAMMDQIKAEVEKAYKEDTSHKIFASNDISRLFHDMPDAHTVAVVCSSLGMPLYKAEMKRYTLSNGQNTQINPEPLDRYKEKIKKIVETL